MEHVLGNVFVRPMAFARAGDVVEGHAHNFAHVTYVARGALRFERLRDDGSVERMVDRRASDGHNYVLIHAGVTHRIIALDDDSLGHCIYAHRNPQGEVVQEFDGWTPGYV